jgi:hypothetical protein
MKNSEEQAFPFRSVSHSEIEDNNFGLTKREYFAIKCLHGILAGNIWSWDRSLINDCHHAIEHADELLRQLES